MTAPVVVGEKKRDDAAVPARPLSLPLLFVLPLYGLVLGFLAENPLLRTGSVLFFLYPLLCPWALRVASDRKQSKLLRLHCSLFYPIFPLYVLDVTAGCVASALLVQLFPVDFRVEVLFFSMTMLAFLVPGLRAVWRIDRLC